jgi:hypothetical protein
MRTFEHFPKQKRCLVCKTNEDKECVLIINDGKIEGNIGEAEIVHLDCINLVYNEDKKLFYQVL